MTSGISRINPKPSTSRGWEFNWDFHTYVDLETDRIIYEKNNTFYYNNKNEVDCFTATAEPGLVLTNMTKEECNSEDFDLNPKGTEFGTDNCATHHICYDKSLFVGDIRPISNIGVKGISGCAQAEGIGTVEFTLLDDKKEEHNIRLDNVIYLPVAAKNLISISQWTKDRKDNCGVISRGDCSMFLWDHDQCTKLIPHCPQCPIPMMPVNESEDLMALLASSVPEVPMEDEPLMPEGNPGIDS